MSMNDNAGGFGGGIPPQPDLSGGFGALSEPTDDADLSGGKKRRKRKKVKGEGSQEPRLLSSPRKFAIILAVLAALAIGGLVLFGGGSSSYVATVTSNVNALSPVIPSNVAVVKMESSAIETGAISGADVETVKAEALKAITDTTTQYPLYAGQQLHPGQFSNSGATLSKPLGPQERLISLRATVSSSVAGALKAGDHVDIVATDNSAGGLAGVIAQNVEIVKVSPNESTLDSSGDGTTSANGSTTTEGKDQSAQAARPVGGTYIVRIPATLAPTISSVDSSASRVYLVYRSPNAQDAQVLATTLRQTICKAGGC